MKKYMLTIKLKLLAHTDKTVLRIRNVPQTLQQFYFVLK